MLGSSQSNVSGVKSDMLETPDSLLSKLALEFGCSGSAEVITAKPIIGASNTWVVAPCLL